MKSFRDQLSGRENRDSIGRSRMDSLVGRVNSRATTLRIESSRSHLGWLARSL
jgi:hypothetical protein